MLEKFKFTDYKKITDKFAQKRIMVVGDLLLDQYIWGNVSRISPEAPVPVVWVKKEGYVPGGSCNVANNLVSLGAKVLLAGVIGDDSLGDILKGKLSEKNIDIKGILVDHNRPTSLKTRVIAHNQQVVRIDRESVDVLDERIANGISDYVKENIDGVDGVIIEDYGKGVITPKVLRNIVPLIRRKKKIVSVDPKEDHFSYYRGVTVITPNHSEAEKAYGAKMETDEKIRTAGVKLLKRLGTESILLTLGEKGMMLFEKDKVPYAIPTVAREVYDVSGAGDTVIAVYTLSLASGGAPRLSAHLANSAAGIVVGKIGTAAIQIEELLDMLSGRSTDTQAQRNS
ncbi:MAG: D-glycero-beta-D-manno-heptose-7-phosphate kinase [Candidatus Omnitrophica bacterium]|nr:D-glycero-beta-D-manno-heptose-7-phosphate kinase [Candidatus Omnitrophota bacterium]